MRGEHVLRGTRISPTHVCSGLEQNMEIATSTCDDAHLDIAKEIADSSISLIAATTGLLRGKIASWLLASTSPWQMPTNGGWCIVL